MTNPTWHFEKMSRAGSITGQAVVDSLTGADLSVEEVFAREALQNSCDATLPNLPTRIMIKEIPVSTQCNDVIEYEDKLSNHVSHSINVRKNRDHTQKHVIIEDYNTCGLGGSLVDANETDHFMRLVYHNATGLSKKGLGAGTGGSFGRGKAAYPYASDINTVFYYSVFKNEHNESDCRLIGVSYSKEYFVDSVQMTGRAFWGIRNAEEDDFFVAPLTGSSAHEYAEKIGFRRRADNELGTSILIMNCPVNLSDLCRAIELWWWPRLTDELLHVGIKDLDDNPYYLQYRSDIILNKYVTIYEAIKTHMYGNDISSVVIKEDNITYGELAYSIIDSDKSYQVDADDDIKMNSIALIRGPKMVVTYLSPRRISNKNFGCGIFMASNDSGIDSFFKRSEPPAHDQWSHKSERLDEQEKVTLSKIKQRIAKLFRDFVNKEDNNNTNDVDYHGRELERQIGAILGGSKGLKPQPNTSRGDAVSITNKKSQKKKIDSNFTRHEVSFSISLRREYDKDNSLADVDVITQLAARGSVGSALQIAYSNIEVDGQSVALNENGVIRLNISKKPIKFKYVTHPVDSIFQTESSIVVKIIESENK